MAALDYPAEVQAIITKAIFDLTAQMREKGIPDDWRIDITMEADPDDRNMVRLVATPRPPFDRWSD